MGGGGDAQLLQITFFLISWVFGEILQTSRGPSIGIPHGESWTQPCDSLETFKPSQLLLDFNFEAHVNASDYFEAYEHLFSIKRVSILQENFNKAITSARIPPPHPMSNTVYPSKGLLDDVFE